MFDTSTVQLDWQGLNLKLETGLVARQADGAVVATMVRYSVLCTVCASKSLTLQLIFSPLCTLYRKSLCCWKNTWGIF